VTLEELAEDTLAYLTPSPMFEPVPADGQSMSSAGRSSG
jgi:hypothetical protein